MLIDESGRREPIFYKSKPMPKKRKPGWVRLRIWQR
jgi:hypothetical protein